MVHRGPRAGRRHIRVPQELGTPWRFHLFIDWLQGEVPDPKLPGPKSASDLVGRTKTGARDGNRHAKETKRVGMGARESEHLIVPLNRDKDIQDICRAKGPCATLLGTGSMGASESKKEKPLPHTARWKRAATQ